MARSVIMALSLVVAMCYSFQPQKKDLASIRYRFSPCNATGRTGPSYESCKDYYLRKNSLVVRNSFTYPQPADWLFENAQVFKVPRVGLYNITVAGAAGGVGVCNFEQGSGMARQVQVELYPGVKLLILVGQRGLGFCDLQPTSPQCLSRPVNLSEVAACEERWSAQYSGNESVLAMLGGGGGGGASMVRSFREHDDIDPDFDSDPIAVGAGGGGSPAVLHYEVVDELGVAEDGLSAEEAYRRFMNAKSDDSDTKGGGPGLRNSSGPDAAGVGGGYSSAGAVERLDVDGGFLTSRVDFAVGGMHCGGLADVSAGGFGGGGGGCGGGGGGGGFTGGGLLGEGGLVPGGGGVSYTGSLILTSFKLIRFVGDALSTEQDGYVDIVNADCECVFRCEVYHTEDKFRCVCPGGTYIAPDSSDCYDETTLPVSEGSIEQLPPDEDGIVFNYQVFTLENRVFLYSVDFAVVLDGEVEEDEPETVYEHCIVGFLGEDYELVAHTDVHRRSVQRLNTLSLVTSEGSQSLVPFFDTPVAVIAGLVVSAGNCSVENMAVNMNVSIRGRQVDNRRNVDAAIPMEVAEELERFTAHLTTLASAVTVPSNDNVIAVSVTVSVVAALFIFVVALILCIVCIKWRHRNSRKFERVSASDSPLQPLPSKTQRKFLLDTNNSTEVGRGEEYVLFKCVEEY